MKQNSCVYIISPDPIFTLDKIELFETFDKKNTVYLNLSLILNHKEILNEISDEINFIFCFNGLDKNNLPDELSTLSENIFYLENKNFIFKTLSSKYFKEFSNNILIFANSIGFSKNDILKTLNLLTNDDETLILGKTENQKLSFIGFNNFNPEIINSNLFINLDYDLFLKKVFCFDNFIYTLENFMLIEKKEDFKKLYHELSKKDSFSYCSPQIHEMFTNLFIEYKEILN